MVLTCLREEQADRLDAAVGVLRGSHGREIRTEAFPSLSDLAYRVSEGACAMIVADPSRADPCRSRVPREVVVGDLRPAVAATLLDIRRRDPYAPLVVYSSRSLLPNTLLELGRIGVSSILIHGHNDRPRAVAEVLLTAFCGTAGQRFLATVPSTTTPEVRALIAELVGEPAAVARVGDLARRVYVTQLPPAKAGGLDRH